MHNPDNLLTYRPFPAGIKKPATTRRPGIQIGEVLFDNQGFGDPFHGIGHCNKVISLA